MRKFKDIGSGYGRPDIRFWNRVDKEGPIHSVCGQCWQWLGGKFASGYGVFWADNKTMKAHRYSWIFHFGPIPEDKILLHSCDNKLCVNPEHLSIGTYADNIADMVSKNRHPKGEGNGQSKLTEEIITEIRACYRRYSRNSNSIVLAKRFGVTPGRIMAIVKRKSWKHI
jgi:hypothetical protein